MNMQYLWSQSELEADDLPVFYSIEETEKTRPAPENEDTLGKVKDLLAKTPPMPSEKPKVIEVKPAAAQLSAKIKEAMQTDYDAEESLAAIRAILVGPARRMHDARIEEIVSILEETDQANQIAFRAMESQYKSLSAKLDAEVKKVTDLQLRYLAEFSFAVDKKFELTQTEMNGQIAACANASTTAITQLSHEFTVQFKDHDRKIAGNFDSLINKFEERFLKLDEHADQLQQRSADVFVEGLNDIARRLTALKRPAA
jgi:hypothetical protein